MRKIIETVGTGEDRVTIEQINKKLYLRNSKGRFISVSSTENIKQKIEIAKENYSFSTTTQKIKRKKVYQIITDLNNLDKIKSKTGYMVAATVTTPVGTKIATSDKVYKKRDLEYAKDLARSHALARVSKIFGISYDEDVVSNFLEKKKIPYSISYKIIYFKNV